MKKLYFAVTNDLVYDQRMIRICTSLSVDGYCVVLVGRRLPSSPPLNSHSFQQKRLSCFFTKGKAFYIEFNLRLFIFLLGQKVDCICAVDLDTILPCHFAAVIKKARKVYDAHELFCEMKEIVTRPAIHAIWKKIEGFSVPRFTHGYTVNQPIAEEFRKMYGVNYMVIRNFPLLENLPVPPKPEKYILYQGAVNEGRSFETLIPAMAMVDCRLVVCGDGNFMSQARQLAKKHRLEEKILFKGKLLPAELKEITRQAFIGITIFDDTGLSNYLSLANRFSDYIHAGIPQVCVDYPVYRAINDKHNVAVLIDDLRPEKIAEQLNLLLNNDVLYSTLQQHCITARQSLNWQAEEVRLVSFYKNLVC